MRRIRGLLALLLLLALAVGLPWALAQTIGNPLHQWSSIKSGDMSDQAVIAIMAAVAYLAWATFMLALLVELTADLVAVVTRRPRREIRIPLLGAQQHLARTLLAGVLLLAPAVISVVGPATSAFATAAPPAATETTSTHLQVPSAATARVVGGSAPRTATPPRQVDTAQQTSVYRIPEQGGLRTYWALAEHYLHDGQRWPEIWELNQGRHQGDGSTMDSPQLLRRGWTVVVPVAETGQVGEHAVTVQTGDTLSGLAADAGLRDWHQAWEENEGRAEPDGQRFIDPNLIRPGWTIALPGGAGTGAPSAPTHATPAKPLPPPHPQPSQPTHATPTDRTRAAQPAQPAPMHTAPAQTTGPAQPSTPERPSPLAPQHSEPAAPPASSSTRTSSELVTVAEWAAVLSAGAGLLAASTFLVLRQLRRRQFRYRSSGRAIAAPAPRHVPLETVLVTDGFAGVRDVDFIDRALRGLAAALAETDGQLPAITAVRLTEQHLDLVLAEPTTSRPPAPWVAVTDASWAIDKTAELPPIEGYENLQAAPYPTLVSVGYTAAGEEWLVDLEHAGSLTMTGDTDRCLDLARFAVAELAHNAWSDQLTVTLAGFGEEMVELNPTRLTAAPGIAAAATSAAADVHAIRELGSAEHVDVLQGRLRGINSDSWMPQLLFLAPAWPDDPVDESAVRQLLMAVDEQPHTAPIAVVLLSNRTDGCVAAGLHLDVDTQGVLRIAELGITATAQQLPAEQAGELAQYLAALRDSSADAPMPPAISDADDSPVFTDRAGAVLPEHTLPRPETLVPPPAGAPGTSATSFPPLAAAVPASASLLPKPAETYLAATAVTAADVEALAPVVKPEVSDALLAMFPHLDEDLAAWHDPQSKRAKLRLVGEVAVTAFGQVPESNVVLVTEAITYLVLHLRGVSGDQFAAEMWPAANYTIKDSNPKNLLHLVRIWLGINPLTGERYLPHARCSGQGSAAALYRVSGLLVDWELFIALRARAEAREARGQDGLSDLAAALELVRGRPLTARRRRKDKTGSTGWGWTVNDDVSADESVMTAAIVDVARLVATRALESGDLELARRAAELAVNLGCGSDKPLLDLAAVCEAQGRTAELAATVRRIVTHHGKVVEEDIPTETYEVLLRRGWVGLTQAS